MTKNASMERKRRTTKKEEVENQKKVAKRNRLITAAAVIVGVVVVSAVVYLLFLNEEDDPCGEDVSRALTDIPPEERDGYFSAYPELVTDPSKEYEACIRTEKGDIRLSLFADQSPLAVNSFVFLARQGFYDGTTFHRVIEDFMAQAGDPTGTGTGGPGYAFEDEVSNGLIFDRAGLLAMANTGQPVTNGSQFFITYNETPWLNGRHTIFGEVIEGQDILNELNLIQPDPTGRSLSAGELIERINIIER